MNELTNTALDLAHRDHFTVSEWLEREKCINAVRVYEKSRYLAELALLKIRDKKLYRPYKTLKEFCHRMFGWSDRRTQQVLAAEKVVAALPEGKRTIVRTESQARELAQVPPEKRVEVLERAKKDGEITAKSIKEASEKTSGSREKRSDILDLNGRVVPKAAIPYWNRKPEAKSILGQISAARGQVERLDVNDPMWGGININGVMSDLNAAYNRFAAAVPAYVCPYCDGVKPANCKTCKGRGVISKYFWKLVPEELRKKHEH